MSPVSRIPYLWYISAPFGSQLVLVLSSGTIVFCQADKKFLEIIARHIDGLRDYTLNDCSFFNQAVGSLAAFCVSFAVGEDFDAVVELADFLCVSVSLGA